MTKNQRKILKTMVALAAVVLIVACDSEDDFEGTISTFNQRDILYKWEKCVDRSNKTDAALYSCDVKYGYLNDQSV